MKNSIGVNPKVILVIAALMLTVSSLVYLNRSYKLVPINRYQELTGPFSKENHCYIAFTGLRDISSHLTDSPAIVLENGNSLAGQGNADHQSIRENGKGRYSFWHDHVYFSTSDNSDPNLNGRVYSITFPFVFTKYSAIAIYILTFILLIYTLNIYHHEIIQFVTRVPIWLPLIILLLVFLVSRLPFYIDYPIVSISPDAGSYVNPILQYQRGELPDFTIRPPGYPLFIYIITLIVDKWIGIIIAQSIVALLSGLALIVTAYNIAPIYSIFTSLAVSVYLCSTQVLSYETSAGSDSLYSSLSICLVALFLVIIQRKSLIAISASSVVICLIVLTKPAGMYLLVIQFILAVFMLVNRWGKRSLTYLLLPCYLILLSFCLYNYYSKRVFSISAFGENNLAGATLYIWEPDASLPDNLNQLIKNDLPLSLKNAGIDEQARSVISNSWDPRELFRIFANYYNPIVYSEGWGWGDKLGSDYLSARSIIAKASITAIRKNPRLYTKFVWSNFSMFFLNLGEYNDFYELLKGRVVNTFYLKSKPFSMQYAKEYKDQKIPLLFWGYNDSDNTIKMHITKPALLHSYIILLDNLYIHNTMWIVLYYIVLLTSIIRLIISRFKDQYSFLLFIITLIPIGAAFLVSLVEISLGRYSFPTQFIYYLSVALFPLMFTNKSVNLVKEVNS